MTFPAATPYDNWMLFPPHDSSIGFKLIHEAATIPFIIEELATHAEIAAVGRKRFTGTMAQRNILFNHFRNFMRQALSNFSAAQTVPNRSACLLYYYAALNFAKAELMDSHHTALVNTRIGHGLSFNPTNAKTVAGDVLRVVDGVFPLLYEQRTGHVLPVGTELPVKRLLRQVPEIASQVSAVGLGACQVDGIMQMIAGDARSNWLLWLLTTDEHVRNRSHVTGRLFTDHFYRVEPPPEWLDNMGVSRRWHNYPCFYESRKKIPRASPSTFTPASVDIAAPLRPFLGLRSQEEFDAWLSPSLFKTKLLPMPPSLARYALTYYASSLVRYKPQMFDGHVFAEQAHLFDAVARELALPMVADVLAAVVQQPVFFFSSGSLRI